MTYINIMFINILDIHAHIRIFILVSKEVIACENCKGIFIGQFPKGVKWDRDQL